MGGWQIWQVEKIRKKNGFIATSLIYSFFLVFVAVVMALVNSYIANKTILSRFNEEIIENLNSPDHTITIYSRSELINSALSTGRISNMIKNGNFQEELGDTNWKKAGTADFSTADGTVVIKNTNSSGYIYQSLSLTENHIYYYSAYYFQPLHSASLEIGFLNDANISKTHQTSQVGSAGDISRIGFERVCGRYVSAETKNLNFVLGRNTSYYSGLNQYKDIIVVDLTQNFGVGMEPNVGEANNTIPWFDGEYYFVRKSAVEKGTDQTITLSAATISSISCSDAHGAVGVAVNKEEEDTVLTFSSVISDIECILEVAG